MLSFFLLCSIFFDLSFSSSIFCFGSFSLFLLGLFFVLIFPLNLTFDQEESSNLSIFFENSSSTIVVKNVFLWVKYFFLLLLMSLVRPTLQFPFVLLTRIDNQPIFFRFVLAFLIFIRFNLFLQILQNFSFFFY